MVPTSSCRLLPGVPWGELPTPHPPTITNSTAPSSQVTLACVKLTKELASTPVTIGRGIWYDDLVALGIVCLINCILILGVLLPAAISLRCWDGMGRGCVCNSAVVSRHITYYLERDMHLIRVNLREAPCVGTSFRKSDFMTPRVTQDCISYTPTSGKGTLHVSAHI